MNRLMRKRKLKSEGFPILEDAVNPESVIWENFGTRKSYHCKIWSANVLLAASLLALTFFGMYLLACKEKDRINYVQSDCQLLDPLSKRVAFDDFKSAQELQIGKCRGDRRRRSDVINI